MGKMLRSIFVLIFYHSIREKRFTALTLAEILIVLFVIGTVASLTIPQLINSINKADLAIIYKKKQAILAQAFNTLKAEQGGSTASIFSRN